MLKNMFLLLIFSLLVSCADKSIIEPGKTTKAALIQSKGEPLREEEIPSGEVLTFEQKEKIQLTNGVVTNIFQEPKGDEKNALFWRHKFKDCETAEKSLSNDAMPEIELSCPEQGLSVVYVKSTGKVLRVNRYEAP